MTILSISTFAVKSTNLKVISRLTEDHTGCFIYNSEQNEIVTLKWPAKVYPLLRNLYILMPPELISWCFQIKQNKYIVFTNYSKVEKLKNADKMWISLINRENQMILSCTSIQILSLINPKSLQKAKYLFERFQNKCSRFHLLCNQWFNLKITSPLI